MSTPQWRTREARDRREAYLWANPLCVPCQAAGLVVAATEIHHREAQSKRPDLILDERNWLSVCVPCHREYTRREFGRKKRVGPGGRLEG